MSSLGLDRERILALLGRLDEACVEAGIDAELFLVGGAAMALMYDVGRATRDLDGIFAPSAELRAIIARLGADEDLQPDWLNDAAKGFLPGNDPHAQDGYVGQALRVQVASPRYLLAMKLLSARPERDFDDAVRLAELAGIDRHEELLAVLDEHYPPSAIPAKCRYFAGDVVQSLRTAGPTTSLDGPWPGTPGTLDSGPAL